MIDLTQLIETKLAASESNLHRAAVRMVTKTKPETRIKELLDSEAGPALRCLTLVDLASALSELVGRPARSRFTDRPRSVPKSSKSDNSSVTSISPVQTSASDQERLYRAILDALTAGPLTIGQLSRNIQVDIIELRGYLAWMHRMGKVSRSGRARATRYALAE